MTSYLIFFPPFNYNIQIILQLDTVNSVIDHSKYRGGFKGGAQAARAPPYIRPKKKIFWKFRGPLQIWSYKSHFYVGLLQRSSIIQ